MIEVKGNIRSIRYNLCEIGFVTDVRRRDNKNIVYVRGICVELVVGERSDT